MDIPRPTSGARRSIPPKPDASLAEWTSKIKAMQKQVDDDEEAETRILEAEIAASRKARMRRSTLGSRANSVDLSQSELASALKSDDRSVVSDESLTVRDKQRNQDDALRKLMGEDHVSSPKPSAQPPVPRSSPVPTPASAPTKRPSSPISLAAFIGGRATGPRLTKHAPQQDAHDPTQFEQRSHVSAPHPIFGRGGVAMPGMTGHASASATSRAIREEESKHAPPASALSQRERRISTPASGHSVRFAMDARESTREVPPNHLGTSQAPSRQRTISTPPGTAPSMAVHPAETVASKARVDPVPRPISSHSSSPSPRVDPTPRPSPYSPTPKADPIPRPVSRSPNPAASTPIIRPISHRSSNGSLSHSGSKSPAPRPHSAASHTSPPSPTRLPNPVPLPGLARPIQPIPRPSFGSPQTPPSHNPSPAFLKPPPAKEPTPSLSRLQGRGFVKSVVERSATLEATPEASPDRPSPSKRQSSVLDRWQHNGSGSPTPPPVISPKPMPLRKSFTADPGSPTASSYSVPLKRESTGQMLKSKSSLPSLPTMKTGESVGSSSVVSEGYSGPKLGSAKTVITYIEPTKTGDQPVSPPRVQVTGEADELGMRVRTRTTSGGLVQERGEAGLPVGMAGKPLSHPTKERAKKPRKGKSTPAAVSASKLTSIREASPARNELLHASHTLVGPERSQPSSSPSQTVVSTRTTSPVSQYPSPPASTGRTLPVKPTVGLHAGSTTPTVTSPLAPSAPPQGSSPSVTPPHSHGAPPASPRQHTRIPSTGNRATVMDVAQAFSEALQRSPASPLSSSPLEVRGPAFPSLQPLQPRPFVHAQHTNAQPHAEALAAEAAKEEAEAEAEEFAAPSVQNMVANWGPRAVVSPAMGEHSATASDVNGASGRAQARTTITAPPMEKRKSSYEKYSAFIMPPLAEERTPVPSPAGTMKDERAPDPALLQEGDEDVADLIKAGWGQSDVVAVVEKPPIDVQKVVENAVAVPESRPTPATEVKQLAREEFIHLRHDDGPLPQIDVDALYRAPRHVHIPDPDVSTISVEVLSILGTTASSVNKDCHVFYDTETLAIVHRAKVKSSGLVATQVWAWRGRHAKMGERELQKALELARRYGAALVMVEQAREPAQLVSVLGGTLATRQGTRMHWSAENTAMHLVRSRGGVVHIDELDLGIKNLCSGYSYCISILDTFYVWHGRGSIPAEQRAAREYAHALAAVPESVLELTEDESSTEDMFWMILGEGEYARADYWRWRPASAVVDPRVWVVDAGVQDKMLQLLPGFPATSEVHRGVYLVDCIWELFVLIGSEARGRRLEIRLALTVAEELAKKASSTRPFEPTVHALVFPTQVPTDLLLTFRELDEFELNIGDIPDHMNLIPSINASADLQSTRWARADLEDAKMLPLGVTPSRLG